MKAMLRRVTWNKGVTEDGMPYDYTRVFFDIPVYDQASNEFGMGESQYEYGLMEDHQKLKDLKGKLPIMCEFDFQVVKKGGKELKMITHLQPVTAAK